MLNLLSLYMYNSMHHFTILLNEKICVIIGSESYLNANVIINVVSEVTFSSTPPTPLNSNINLLM